ncbi:30S ribosomal protein S7 [Patescibacteria group bacterium]|nr:30S ribosomal protein S7 [Patescibacteria group bacterium]MBU1074852.1 30S ribosomal protein S7 [Patescibacteria group bacterium]MBU1951391.1 30S ribosomal protein S7 [Patescibacteria group bacterium]MBU2229420.1 30S ribosomal protein S7 [Patescibacteria group bacterium]MBU2235434.1 30S ribosomal protein S7 [Patescibacteria group bacterium]
MRGKQAPKRVIQPDLKYNSVVIAKFINLIMTRGKKSVAERVLYDSFDIIQQKTKKDPLEVFNQAMKNVSPVVEVKSRRIGGANYQIPIEVKGDRRSALAMRWIITAAQSRKGRPMREKLSQELMDAAEDQGAAIKKREDVHRMAEANRAFAHFA